MKRPLKIISILIVVVIVLVAGLLWRINIRSPEKLFKATMNEFNRELSGESREKDVGYTISRLHYVADNYPESIWADDAQRILADLYICWDPERAIDEYRKIIEKFPNSKIEEWTLENCTFTSFLRVINEIPAAAESQVQIAIIYYYKLKNYQKAIEESQKVIDFFPDITPSDKRVFIQVVVRYHTIAKSYKALGDLEKAEKTYQIIIDRFPGTKAAQIAQGKIKKLKSQS